MKPGPTQYDLEKRWTTKEGIPGVGFHFSDLVRIRSGEYSGEVGEVISLHSIEPEVVYGLVLPPNEKFVMLPEHELDPTGSSAGRTLTQHKLD